LNHQLPKQASSNHILPLQDIFVVTQNSTSKTAPQNFRLDNLAFMELISFLIGFLTVYAGWIYWRIELWLANGFLNCTSGKWLG